MNFKDTIQIDSNLDTVWNVTLDIQKWPLWTPTIEKVYPFEGQLEVGKRITIKQPGRSNSIWTVKTIDSGKLKKFSWLMSGPGIKVEAIHLLEQQNDHVKNELELIFSGPVGSILSFFLRKKLLIDLKKENLGLKKYCEQLRN